MEEVYELSQHTHCVTVFIRNNDVYVQLGVFSDANKKIQKIDELSEMACITYNCDKNKVLSWGATSIKYGPNDIHVNEFTTDLYTIYEYKNYGERELFFIMAISEFLKLIVTKLVERNKIKMDLLHYAFVTHQEWEIEVQEDVIRPLFIKANLIEKNDHKDRLLFISDVESICYFWSDFTRKGENLAIYKSIPVNHDTVLVTLDLVAFSSTLFDLPKSILTPRVSRLYSFKITSNEIKNSIKYFLKYTLGINNTNGTDEKIIEAIYRGVNNNVSDNDDDNTKDELHLLKDYKDALLEPFIENIGDWKLDNVRPFDICTAIDKSLLQSFVEEATSSMKKHVMLHVTDNYSSDTILDSTLSTWIKYFIEYLANKKKYDRIHTEYISLDLNNIIFGGQKLVGEAIQYSNMHSPLRIIPSNDRNVSSSVFINSRPDAIFKIDISHRSTFLSFTLFPSDGLVEKPLGHDYCTEDKHILSLDQYYDLSSSTKLTVNPHPFIYLVDNYFNDNLNLFDDNNKILPYLNVILQQNSSSFTKHSVTVVQKKYLRAFFLLYLIHIEQSISSKLLNYMKSEDNMNIGYAIIIEKTVLDKVIGDKQILRELVYASKLLSKNDGFKKLRVITKEESLMANFEQSFALFNFPVKCYFLMAQLHEDYIQLTLKQVVTPPDLNNGRQEAIIIEDEIVSIQNIYDTLCFLMWDNLSLNYGLIHLCNLHLDRGESTLLKLLSLENRTVFMTNFRQYISNNILSTEEFNMSSTTTINVSHSCNCKVYLEIKDVIEIAFKPLLKDIASSAIAPLKDNYLFREYQNIEYHFSAICFNCNAQFQKILADILEKEINILTETGTETDAIILRCFPDQPHLPLLLFLYNGFKKGSLYRCFDKNYAYTIYDRHKRQEMKDSHRFLKKLDVISSTEICKRLSFDRTRNFRQSIRIDIYEYDTSGPSNDEPVSTWKLLKTFAIRIGRKQYTTNNKLPFMITIKSLGYSPGIKISVKLIGEETSRSNITELGKPTTLCRF